MRVMFLSMCLCAAGCGSSASSSADGPTFSDLSLSGTSGDLSQSSSGDLAMSMSDMAQPAGADLAGVDFAAAALCCGQPGDVGNEVGVGKYCNTSSDCTGIGAPFCANLGGDPQLHFCTNSCSMGSTACGTNASCLCQNGQCGCVPDSCKNMPATC